MSNWFSDLGKKIKKTFKKVSNSILTGSAIYGGLTGDIGGALFGGGIGGTTKFFGEVPDKELYKMLEGYIPGTNINPIDRYLGRDIAQENFESQKEAYEYQKWLNEQQMTREDEAYQRKLKDMTAAGFNPILASGGSGESTSPLRAGSAPQMADTSEGLRGAVGQALSLMTGFAGLKKMKAETSLLKSQADYQNIVNKHEDALRGLKVESETLANRLASGTLDLKIHSLVQDIDLKDKEIINRDLENALKRFDVDNLDLERVRRQLINSGLDLKNQSLDNEITLKGVAILQKWAEYNQYQFQADVMNKYGLWAGFSGGEKGNFALMMTQAIMSGVDLIGGKGGELFKGLLQLCGFGNGDDGSIDKPLKFSKSEMRELLKRPEGSNFLWTREMNKTGDYGVRRNF